MAITVTPVNDAPVAANDSYTATEDTLLTSRRRRAGQRHRSRRAMRCTALLVAGPAHGTLTLNANGSLHLHAGGQLQRAGQLHL